MRKDDLQVYLELAVSLLPAHIYWKDENGMFLACNDAQAISAGFSSSREVIGKTDYEMPWKNNADEIRKNDKEVIQYRKSIIKEETSLLANGEKAIFLSQKVPLINKKNQIIGVLGVSIDITDRKKAEQLQQEKEVAEQVSRTIEMLAGCIAHEMRTPLSVIGVNADMLYTAEQENKIEFVNNIRSAVKNGSNIIDMFLVKIRSTIAKQVHEHKFELSSIKSCINEVIGEYPFYNDDRKKVVWDDKSNKDFIYMGDNLFTKHVLFNLIKNALRAIKEADRGKIYISLRTDEGFNYMIFKDTASGMPAKVLKSLFQSFSSNSRGGTGLGLAFCKMTMQSYDGDITCDSKEGEYTEFTLSFPKIEAAKK